MKWEKSHRDHHTINKDELREYSRRGISRIMMFKNGKMLGDGFLQEYKGSFYVFLDWEPMDSRYLDPSEIIGIELEGRMGFYKRIVVL